MGKLTEGRLIDLLEKADKALAFFMDISNYDYFACQAAHSEIRAALAEHEEER